MTNLISFQSPSGRAVSLNTSLVAIALVKPLPKPDLFEVIKEHERLRSAEFWDLMVRPAEAGPWVVGLENRKGTDGFPALSHLLGNALQHIAGSGLKGAALTDSCRRMSLAEQQAMFLLHVPQTRMDLKRLLRNVAPAFAPDFPAMLAEHRQVVDFLNHLVSAVAANSAPLYHTARYVELLVLLWTKGYLLFPLEMRKWSTKAKWSTLTNPRYTGPRAAVVDTARHALKAANDSDCNGLTYQFFASTDVTSVADYSLELIASFEQWHLRYFETTLAAASNSLYGMKSKVTQVALMLRLQFNATNPSLAVATTRTHKSKKQDAGKRGDGTFRWLAEDRPDLVAWADALRDYVSQLKTARIDGQLGKLNFLADFIVSLPTPPVTPLDIDRPLHVYDATLRNVDTYYEYIRKEIPPTDRANSTLAVARTFFDWYADFLVASRHPRAREFKNPVLSTDSFGGRNRGGGQTARDALPSYVLNEMKELLLENDFAFGRAFRSSLVRVVDQEAGVPVKAWFPGLTVCLYLMLEVPVRSHQARWLDSGELDELVYDLDSKRYTPNSSPYSLRGRNEGVLRVQHDTLRSADWLGLWVNTNKTALYDSANVGFLIPYVSDKLAELLRGVLVWQKRYQPPVVEPIAYYGEKHSSADRKRVAQKGPQIVPLFRDPTGYHKNAPLGYSRLVSFYTAALAEAQVRIKRKFGHDIQLVTRDDDGTLQWAVDLHSLRVSGITSMIENGVPLEVVSQFVAGHATLVMTLHYLRYSPLKIRELLADAHTRALADTDFVGSELFAANLDAFSPFMLGQAGAGTGPGFGALQEKSGILTITSEGICPGTSCSTGGPVDSTKVKNGPVPGGRRCGLCRYWLTGPAHLLGQVAAVNNLAYAIRKKGLEVASLNEARLDAEDSGNQRKARELRDRVDVLNRELAIDVDEWAARYRYAEQSVALLNDYLAAKAALTGDALPVPILTASTSAELKVTLEEAHEFALLDQITQLNEFVTGFPNREAELEKNNILSRMMAANGIKPFLLNLTDAQAHEAGNLLSAVLLQQVRSQELDDVLCGKKPLAQYPQLSEAIKLLETEASGPARKPLKPGWTAVIGPVAGVVANRKTEETRFA